MTTNGIPMDGPAALAAAPQLSIVGRSDLVDMVVRLRAQLVEAWDQEEQARKVVARAETLRAIMEEMLAATQAHCTLQLEELRKWRQNGFPDLLRALERARTKHPKGARFHSLVEETGEVARALDGEGLERVREELLDTAAVAMRLYLGEVCEPLVGDSEQGQ